MEVQGYFCYLLKSQAKPNSQSTYVGFATNPYRRLRQHNGELVAGAVHTSKYRPWRHVAIVGGFPNKVSALQFEWQWQHPHLSRLVLRKTEAKTLAKRKGSRGKLQILALLLSIPLWRQLNLHIYTLDASDRDYLLSLLPDFKVSQTSEDRIMTIHMEQRPRPAYPVTSAPCQYCNLLLSGKSVWCCEVCLRMFHIVCTAKAQLAVQHVARYDPENPDRQIPTAIPLEAQCLSCNKMYAWVDVAKLRVNLDDGSAEKGEIHNDTDDDDTPIEDGEDSDDVVNSDNEVELSKKSSYEEMEVVADESIVSNTSKMSRESSKDKVIYIDDDV